MFLKTCLTILSISAIAACGGKSDDGAAKSDKGSKSEPAAKKSEPTLGAPGDVLTGSKPTLPEDVAKAEFGAAKDAVLKAVGVKSRLFDAKKFKDVSYNLKFDDKSKTLKQVIVRFETPAEALATAKWGKPKTTKGAKGIPYWFDADASLRVSVGRYSRGKELVFERYLPLAKMLGATGKALAFASDKALLGATVEELKKAWGDALCDFGDESKEIAEAMKSNTDSLHAMKTALNRNKLSVCRLPMEFESRIHRDKIYFSILGKSRAFTMTVQSEGVADHHKTVVALLTAKFGKPKTHVDGDNVNHFFTDEASQLSVKAVTYKSGDVGITATKYTPLKTLLGTGTRFGFETPEMIGGTFDAIGKAHPATIAKQGNDLAKLVLPQAPFNRMPLEVNLRRWAKKDTTFGYRFVIHYGDYPKFGDELFAALKTKFGEPKRDPKSTDKDVFYDWKDKDGMKIRARQVSEQWQIEVSNPKL